MSMPRQLSKRAAQMISGDVNEERRAKAAEVSETLAERRREHEERYQVLVAEVERIRAHVEDIARFKMWLSDV